MAYRMACQSADLVAAIASLAGGTFLDPGRCAPSEPVSILQIHGTADGIVPYAGGAVTTANPAFPFPWNTPAFPGALRDVQFWAGYNGASGPMTDPEPSLDLTTDVAGVDTVITRYTNSPAGGAVELVGDLPPRLPRRRQRRPGAQARHRHQQQRRRDQQLMADAPAHAAAPAVVRSIRADSALVKGGRRPIQVEDGTDLSHEV